MKGWVEMELESADFGDKRLTNRMKAILTRLSENPNASSIKSTCKGWAETMAAYRFIDNDKVSVEGVIKPHRDATLERAREYSRVLHIQDTSELDYTAKKELQGTGPLSTIDRQGFFSHNQVVVTPERLVLGVWHTQIYARDEAEHGKATERKLKPIEEKESYRWLEGYRNACDLAKEAAETEVIACSDREGDIYEIFAEWYQRRENGETAAEWLIRCNQDRRLAKDFEEEGPQAKIREKIGSSPLLGCVSVVIKAKVQNKKVDGYRQKVHRSGRTATLEIRATNVKLHPPFRKGAKLPPVSFQVVMAKEKDPPENEEPIDWVLLTSLTVPDFNTAVEIVELYRSRWEIEVFHRVLKSGCRIEGLQLKNDQRTKVAIALYMIVAWRVLYVMRLGRECPDLPCDVVFEEDEWRALWMVSCNGESPEKTPSLQEVVIKVAQWGGFLARKGDGQPGPQAIWQGLTRVRDFTLAWQVFQETRMMSED